MSLRFHNARLQLSFRYSLAKYLVSAVRFVRVVSGDDNSELLGSFLECIGPCSLNSERLNTALS